MNVLRIAALLREIATELEKGASAPASPPTAEPVKAPRREPLPVSAFVGVDDVVRALGCSRALAYEHLRRAARRPPGARGLLRVEVRTWEAYVAAQFGREHRGATLTARAVPPPIRKPRPLVRRPSVLATVARTGGRRSPTSRTRRRRFRTRDRARSSKPSGAAKGRRAT